MGAHRAGVAAFNMLFLVAAIMSHPDPTAVGKAFGARSPLPSCSLQLFLLLLASNIGATVTPWMLFFQQSAVADKGVTPRDIRQSRFDTVRGGMLAAAASIWSARGGLGSVCSPRGSPASFRVGPAAPRHCSHSSDTHSTSTADPSRRGRAVGFTNIPPLHDNGSRLCVRHGRHQGRRLGWAAGDDAEFAVAMADLKEHRDCKRDLTSPQTLPRRSSPPESRMWGSTRGTSTTSRTPDYAHHTQAAF